MANVLIMDDEPGVLKFLGALLSRKGYDVILAQDGQQGFDRFLQECPAVIVLDLNMPRMDGLTVLRQVRALSPLQPVIVLTGGTDDKTEQQVRALGVKEFVEKESAVHLLDAALKRVLIPDLPQKLANF